MIHVCPAPEPSDFDEKVRRPGYSAISELIGKGQQQKRRGPKRKQLVLDGVSITEAQDIPPHIFPALWTAAIPDLLRSYRRICAYFCVYIEDITATPTVDHMIPKSRRWDLVYEWSNYRLACSLMNARKGDACDVLDPFDVRDGWFWLEFTGFQVIAAANVEPELRAQVESTIRRLSLNDEECRNLRGEYVRLYEQHQISQAYLEQRAPFISMELRRQGRL